MEPTPPKDAEEGVIRIGCGAVAGLAGGLSTVTWLLDDLGPLGYGLVAACVVVCAVLAYRWGDVFWERVKALLWFI